MIHKYPHLLITLLGILLFIPFLGSFHLFDWDEINFAEAAREMIESGNYRLVQINYEPFWEKPPLFFWFQVFCMKLFGVSEFSARLPNAICGILTLNIIFHYGKKWFSTQLAWWWVLLFIGSFTPHFYFRSGIIDPFFNLFIFLSIIQLYISTTNAAALNKHFAYAGLFLGLALLTKGPVAIIIIGLCGLTYLVINRFKPFFTFISLLVLFLCMLFIPLLWFVPDWIENGFWFTQEFLLYQVDLFLNPVASHGQPWFYHPMVLILACFPAAIIAIPFLFGKPALISGGFVTWMKVLFWVVLILFSMVTTKIVHYSSLCYLPITFLAAWGLTENQGIIKRWQTVFVTILSSIYALAFVLLALIPNNSTLNELFLKYVKDDFVIENLKVNSGWNGNEFWLGVVYLVLIIFSLLVYQFKSKSNSLRFFLLTQASLLFVLSFLYLPKIENHVQGSIISFYKEQINKDVYIETIGFKSYAHYYYSQKKPVGKNDKLKMDINSFCKHNGIDTMGQLSEAQRNVVNGFKNNWFMTGPIDKPVYLVYKINHTEDMDTNRRFKIIMNSGGYKVYLRKATKIID